MPPIFFYALYVLTLGTISIHVRYRNGRELNLTGWTVWLANLAARYSGKRK